MRHNEDCNLLKTRILESTSKQSIPCGAGHALEIQLVANQYLSECRVRVLRAISRSLPLALIGPIIDDWFISPFRKYLELK
jgi:hypothetical protein